MPDTVKLTFEDQGPLQLMLDVVARGGGQAQLLERETGVTVHVRGHEVTLEGDRDGLVERLLRQLYALAQNGAPMDPADLTRALEVLRTNPKAELRELCRTASLALVELVEQRRPHPDPRTFFGQGKLREVLVRALEQDVEVLVCDPELTASQARTIADETDLKVIDRTMLILDIFARHAKSSDGKLQVELAQLRYNLPKMVGKGTMMSRLAGGIGGRGPGETKLEIDRRRAKDRIVDLERRLGGLRKRREQQRAERRRTRVPVAAIVGYTNAGKSTLLNAVTGSNVDAEDKLFATLDPTTRRLRLPTNQNVLLSDTVGFIRKLPHRLVEAFKATLEEVVNADLLVHVVDISHPQANDQIQAVNQVLGELGAGEKPVLMVFNKIDLCTPRTLVEGWIERFPGAVAVSARTGEGFDALRAELGTRLRPIRDYLELAIPHTEAAVVSRLHAVGQVVERKYEDAVARFKARIPPHLRAEFAPFIVAELA